MDVKGGAIVSMRDYVLNNFSSRYQEWLKTFSPEVQKTIVNPLPSSWYPLQAALIEPTAKICSIFHNGDPRGAWQVGRFSADHALKGIYSLFVKLGSPGFIVSRGSRIITNYYRPSGIKIVENQPKRAVVQIDQFEQPDQLVEFRIGGWIERAIELSGKKAVTSITRSMAKGDSVTEFDVQWD